MEEERHDFAEIDFDKVGDRDWQRLLGWASEHVEHLAELLYSRLESPQKRRLLRTLLLLLWRVYRDENWRKERFEAGQSIGMHVYPAHFYSPVPDTSKLDDACWEPRETAEIDWREGSQLDLLNRLSRWSDEMRQWPNSATEDGKAFHFGNQTFDYTDAAVLYAILREFRPKRIIEVGSGWSSLVISSASDRQDTTLIQIDPYPPELLRNNPHLTASRCLAKPVQEVGLDVFQQLAAGDVLFIDSTHVSKIGSDVNDLMFRVTPNIAPGVLIHFHDIMLPREYPRAWLRDRHYFWNEQYLIHAFLMFNSEFEVLLSNAYLFDRHRDCLSRAFDFLPRQNGGSLWLRRRHD